MGLKDMAELQQLIEESVSVPLRGMGLKATKVSAFGITVFEFPSPYGEWV